MSKPPKKSATDQTINASCACGAINVSLAGKPLTMMLCSCKDCQKASGTGHAALALFKADAVAISGETRSFEVIANSGATVSRHFCPECGTPVFGMTSRSPQLRLLPAGLFEDNDWYQPGSLIFARSKRHWDSIEADLAQYQTYKES